MQWWHSMHHEWRNKLFDCILILVSGRCKFEHQLRRRCCLSYDSLVRKAVNYRLPSDDKARVLQSYDTGLERLEHDSKHCYHKSSWWKHLSSRFNCQRKQFLSKKVVPDSRYVYFRSITGQSTKCLWWVHSDHKSLLKYRDYIEVFCQRNLHV